MQHVTLPCGETVPALGQGTWYMGDDPTRRKEEIATLQSGLDQGLGLIDTAEMYGEGRAEQRVGEALVGRRDRAFVVSKVYPHNASPSKAAAACERSLQRLGTDYLDLYLLHWRGGIPLADTMAAFEQLQRDGKIRHYGVSNFDRDDMQELWDTAGGDAVTTNQVLYNLNRRNIEGDLLPWQRRQHLPTMAYSPLDHGRLLDDPKLVDFAQRHGLKPAQTALAWLLSADDVMVIPKTSHRERLQQNLEALDYSLSREQLAELDELFPPPQGPRPLEVI